MSANNLVLSLRRNQMLLSLSMKHIYNLTVTEKYFVTTNTEKAEDSLANFLL